MRASTPVVQTWYGYPRRRSRYRERTFKFMRLDSTRRTYGFAVGGRGGSVEDEAVSYVVVGVEALGSR